MNIGIDIDNTLTDIKQELDFEALNYAKKLKKEIDYNYNEEDNGNAGNYYKNKYKFSYDELKYFLKDIQEKITNNAKPRQYAGEVIRKLRRDNHKIFIITARDSEFHDDPYILSKNWLEASNIEYDFLIVNARNKAPICEKNCIDIFIDDQLNNCIEIAKSNIRVIRLSNENSKNKKIKDLKDWNEIYNYISMLKN